MKRSQSLKCSRVFQTTHAEISWVLMTSLPLIGSSCFHCLLFEQICLESIVESVRQSLVSLWKWERIFIPYLPRKLGSQCWGWLKTELKLEPPVSFLPHMAGVPSLPEWIFSAKHVYAKHFFSQDSFVLWRSLC